MRMSILSDCGCTIVFSGRPKPKMGEFFDEEYHGKKHTSEYERWKGMKSRCFYKGNDASFKYYKSKGIGVCLQWSDSFAVFSRDLGPIPFPSASIDRIDGNKHYCPHNVRWATKKDQIKNRSTPKSERKTKYRIVIDGRVVANFESKEDADRCVNNIKIVKVNKWTYATDSTTS